MRRNALVWYLCATSYFTMRKTKPILPLLLLAASSLLISGCNTTTAKSSEPVLAVDSTDLKAMWGGRIGDALAAPAGPAATQAAGTKSDRASSVTRQYQDWQKNNRL